MKPLTFHEEAEAEIEKAIDDAEKQREGKGRDLRVAIEAGLERITNNPQLFSIYKDGPLRKCVVLKFPYTIFYHELDDRVWIVAVAHQKRRPDYWQGRSLE